MSKYKRFFSAVLSYLLLALSRNLGTRLYTEKVFRWDDLPHAWGKEDKSMPDSFPPSSYISGNRSVPWEISKTN